MNKNLFIIKPNKRFSYAQAQGSISNITGFFSDSEMDIVIEKVLKNLMHRSIGLWAQAQVDNPKQFEGGGTAVFKFQKRVPFGEYTKESREQAPDIVKQEAKKIDRLRSDIARVEYETLELAMFNFVSRDAYINFIVSGINNNLAAYMDGHYLDVFVKDAIERAKKGDYSLLTVNADFMDLKTQDLRFDAFRQVNRAQYFVASTLDLYNIGADEADFATILWKPLIADLLLAMPKAGDTATKVGREMAGLDGNVQIAGLNGMLVQHVFLTKKIDKGTVMSKDVDFDFTNVVGLMSHRESAFVAQQGLQFEQTKDPNSANPKYIVKFNLYKGLVRDDLYRLLVTDKDNFGGYKKPNEQTAKK